MRCSIPIARTPLLLLAAVLLAAAPLPGEAQSVNDTKPSASRDQSSRGSDMRSGSRSSSRSSSRGSGSSLLKSKRRDAEAEAASEDIERLEREIRDLKRERDGEDDDEEADGEGSAPSSGDAHRTLGRSCMYGANGEVIFRPAGARCVGDKVSRSERLEAQRRKKAKTPVTQPAAAHIPGRPAAPAPAAGTPKKASGSCIYGPGDRVVYAPAGVECGR